VTLPPASRVHRVLALTGFALALVCGPLSGQTTNYSDGETNGTALSATGGTLTLNVDSGSATQAGDITDGGGVTKTGAGTLTLSGTNTYSGGTTLSAGTLTGTNADAFGTGTLILAGGALNMSGGNYVIANGMNVTGASTAGGTTSASNVTTYTGPIQLSGGTLTLDATNTGRIDITSAFTGTGNVAISGNNSGETSAGASRVILVSATEPNFTGGLTINSGGLLQLGNSLSQNTVTTHGSLWLSPPGGNTGTITLGGLAGSGVVRVIAGNMQTATLNVGGNNSDTTFSGVIAKGYDGSDNATGSIALLKTGSGTLTLSGTNTYLGGTTISGGTLLVNNASGSALGSGSVTVNSGATLGGSGSIGDLTTVASGGHLAPGASVGTLTFNYGLVLQSGAILDFQLGDPLNPLTSDRIDVTGGSLSGPTTGLITLNLTDAGSFGAGTYDLIRYSGATYDSASLTTANFTTGTSISGFTYTLAFNLTENALQLTATAVPEPATYAAILGALILGLTLYRRRRAR
jgi:autotransporter-associated beta strand protein